MPSGIRKELTIYIAKAYVLEKSKYFFLHCPFKGVNSMGCTEKVEVQIEQLKTVAFINQVYNSTTSVTSTQGFFPGKFMSRSSVRYWRATYRIGGVTEAGES